MLNSSSSRFLVILIISSLLACCLFFLPPMECFIVICSNSSSFLPIYLKKKKNWRQDISANLLNENHNPAHQDLFKLIITIYKRIFICIKSKVYFRSNSAVSSGVCGHMSETICCCSQIIFSPINVCFIVPDNLTFCLSEILKSMCISYDLIHTYTYVWTECICISLSCLSLIICNTPKFGYILFTFLRNCDCFPTIWMQDFLHFCNFPLQNCRLKEWRKYNNAVVCI